MSSPSLSISRSSSVFFDPRLDATFGLRVLPDPLSLDQLFLDLGRISLPPLSPSSWQDKVQLVFLPPLSPSSWQDKVQLVFLPPLSLLRPDRTRSPFPSPYEDRVCFGLRTRLVLLG